MMPAVSPRRALVLLVTALLTLASALIPSASAAPRPSPHTVTYDGYSFLLDGKRTYLWSGEFHY